MILDDIVVKKRFQLKKEINRISIEEMKSGILRNAKSFRDALKRDCGLSIIAEVKKASPSKGVIREDFDAVKIAGRYFAADIQAISVLTEKNYFLGSDDDLVKVRRLSPIPVLRKDFIIDLWQVYQSHFFGADAILLITSILSDEELKEFLTVSEELGMDCLVEVHDRDEIERAVNAGAKIIGINNRDLKTFNVDLETTERLINHITQSNACGRVIVSESGIKTPEDMKYLRDLGVDAVLIGETLMCAESVNDKIDELRMG